MSNVSLTNKVGEKRIFRFDPVEVDHDVKVKDEVIGHVEAGRGVFVTEFDTEEISLVPCTHNEQYEIHSLGPVQLTHMNAIFEVTLNNDCEECEVFRVHGDNFQSLGKYKVTKRKCNFSVPSPQNRMGFAVKVGEKYTPTVQYTGS